MENKAKVKVENWPCEDFWKNVKGNKDLSSTSKEPEIINEYLFEQENKQSDNKETGKKLVKKIK